MGMLLALAVLAAPARAQVGDAAFFAQLGLLEEGFLADVKGSPVAPRPGRELTKDEALRLVLADLGGALPVAWVRRAFDDPRLKLYPDIPGRFKGGKIEEPDYDAYRKFFITDARVRDGAAFYREHAALLADVERRAGVDAGILTALLGVETWWGTKTGTYDVIGALYTITRRVPSRSSWAARELAEWLKLCRAQGVEPFSVQGSYAGAFGYYQFMPSSYNRFAVDYDGDGRKSWNEWPDVLGSVANYLALAGWERGGGFGQGSRNYAAIFNYNHSDNYVRAIVELRGEILKRAVPPAVASVP